MDKSKQAPAQPMPKPNAGTTVEPPVTHSDEPHGAEPMETFQQVPAGAQGNYEANPELKVRR